MVSDGANEEREDLAERDDEDQKVKSMTNNDTFDELGDTPFRVSFSKANHISFTNVEPNF